MTQPIIVIGDKTSHGGTVVGGATTASTHGKQMARKGDKVTCPKCGPTTIAEGDNSLIIMGQPVARHGHKTACGATLIAGQSATNVGGGGSSPGGGAVAASATTRPVSSPHPSDAQLAQAISTDPNYLLASTDPAGAAAPKDDQPPRHSQHPARQSNSARPG